VVWQHGVNDLEHSEWSMTRAWSDETQTAQFLDLGRIAPVIELSFADTYRGTMSCPPRP
jgi:hypothetical protein